jgi:hypothetical protein
LTCILTQICNTEEHSELIVIVTTTTIGVTWLITWGQNRTWALGTSINEGVKLERGEDWFEPVLPPPPSQHFSLPLFNPLAKIKLFFARKNIAPQVTPVTFTTTAATTTVVRVIREYR